MSKVMFSALWDWMTKYGELNEAKKVTVEEQVAVFLAVVLQSSPLRVILAAGNRWSPNDHFFLVR